MIDDGNGKNNHKSVRLTDAAERLIKRIVAVLNYHGVQIVEGESVTDSQLLVFYYERLCRDGDMENMLFNMFVRDFQVKKNGDSLDSVFLRNLCKEVFNGK